MVDLSLCFEDTAILYGICVTFCVLAGFSFFCSDRNGARPSLTIGILLAAKVVYMHIYIIVIMYVCYVLSCVVVEYTTKVVEYTTKVSELLQTR